MRRREVKSILFLVVCAMPLAVFGAAATPDSSFYKNAAEAGLAEVDAGNLATQKANDSKVKDFGAMMVKDHSAANEKLAALATTKNITLPTSASVGEMATQAKLKVLSGDTFDKAYIKAQIRAHKDTIALLNKEIASGTDPDAQAFAKSVLPTVKSHLKAIDGIAAAAGIATK
jgi:putative membrane protein